MAAVETVDGILAELAAESVRAERVRDYHAGECPRRSVKTHDFLATIERSEGRLVATRSTNAGKTHVAYEGEGRNPWLVWSHSEIHARTDGAGPAECVEPAFKTEARELLEGLPVTIVHARDSELAAELGYETVPMVRATRGPIEMVYGPDPHAYERVHGRGGGADD